MLQKQLIKSTQGKEWRCVGHRAPLTSGFVSLHIDGSTNLETLWSLFKSLHIPISSPVLTLPRDTTKPSHPTMDLDFLVTVHITKSYSRPVLNQLIRLNSIRLEEAYYESQRIVLLLKTFKEFYELCLKNRGKTHILILFYDNYIQVSRTVQEGAFYSSLWVLCFAFVPFLSCGSGDWIQGLTNGRLTTELYSQVPLYCLMKGEKVTKLPWLTFNSFCNSRWPWSWNLFAFISNVLESTGLYPWAYFKVLLRTCYEFS